MKKKIVLVLGAGSSHFMGFPLGSALRSDILANAAGAYMGSIVSAVDGISNADVREFKEDFQSSQMESIDAFLARRPEYAEIGKAAIAAALLGKEDEAALTLCDGDDHWYRYFFNQVSSESWTNFDLSHISVITFNYDRSLEHYLLKAISGSYRKSYEEVTRKLNGMRIVHVYGSLGPTLPGQNGYFPYGRGLSNRAMRIAAQNIKVIPEGRRSDESLNLSRALLLEADVIGFMGFGYDRTNLKLLDSRVTCAQKIGSDENMRYRTVLGTSLGMTSAEVRAAASATIWGKGRVADHSSFFYPVGCRSFLRETLILQGGA